MTLCLQNIAFRTDANSQIGTGHFMRCLTLADGLNQRGTHIRFVSRHLPEYLKNMLIEKEYEFVSLDSEKNNMPLDDLAHAGWLGVNQRQDAVDTVNALSDMAWDWLVVDHYALDSRWESAIRKVTSQILVIDDIADRQHDCDILLDQNYYPDMRERYNSKTPSHCILFLGPDYALLRKEFKLLHKEVRPREGPVKRLLVFFGGIDADNYTGRTIEALSQIILAELHVDVVIGFQHPYREKIKSECAKHEFTCYVQTLKMAELMTSADISIGAAGSTTWERCCLGLPTLTLSLADNQVEIAKGLEILGAGKYIDVRNCKGDIDLYKIIFDFLNNDEIKKLSQKAYSTVDGMGVDRICEVLVQ